MQVMSWMIFYIKYMHEWMANYVSQKNIYLPRIGRANLKHQNNKTSESGKGNFRINSSRHFVR
jgi:hypothetical protein